MILYCRAMIDGLEPCHWHIPSLCSSAYTMQTNVPGTSISTSALSCWNPSKQHWQQNPLAQLRQQAERAAANPSHSRVQAHVSSSSSDPYSPSQKRQVSAQYLHTHVAKAGCLDLGGKAKMSPQGPKLEWTLKGTPTLKIGKRYFGLLDSVFRS